MAMLSKTTTPKVVYRRPSLSDLRNLYTFFLDLESDKNTRVFYRFMPCRTLPQKIMVVLPRLLKYLLISKCSLLGKHFISYLAIDTSHERIVGLCHILADLWKGVGRYGIVVLREYRGLGIGRRLSCLALNKAKRVGVKYVLLTVDVDNHAAISLYRKLGFRIVRRVHKCDYRYVTNEYVDCYVMVLDLSNYSGKC